MERSAGILLSVSSLPSPYGIGTMGKAAYDFADFLAAAGQKYWQLLPLGPTSYGDSPYQSFSTFAGNPYLIDLDLLTEDGLLTQKEISSFDWGSVRMKSHSALPRLFTHSIQIEQADAPFLLRLRIPYWTTEKAIIQLNGKTVQPEIVNGYACLRAAQGDNIVFMEHLLPRRIEAHPYVRHDRGRVAIACGPLIYCVEGVDNKGDVDFTLAADPGLVCEARPDLLGGVTVIHGRRADGKRFTAVPLYAWDNRMAGKMRVWLKQEGKPDTWDTDGWAGRLYRDYEP